MTKDTPQIDNKVIEKTNDNFVPTPSDRSRNYFHQIFSYDGNLLVAGLGSLIVVSFYGFTPATLALAAIVGVATGTTNYFLHTSRR